MPVLLTPEQAVSLNELLALANTVGLDCSTTQVEGGSCKIQGLGSLTSASPSEISFLSNPKLAVELSSTRAGAVILTPEALSRYIAECGEPTWQPVQCSQPYLMYALLAQWFDQHRIKSLPAGIHPSAIIHPSAHINEGVTIGPFCVIEEHVQIASGARLGAHCVVGAHSAIGSDTIFHARVTLYHGVRIGSRCIVHSGAVIGADGFGFAPNPLQKGAWAKIAQIGGVLIGNDVEIGANTTIDRGAIEDTVIGHGVKLDNQIMIAHNCQVGDHTAMAACVGVAGSTRIGKRCTIGGASMLSGHLLLGDDVHISGGTAVTSSIDLPGRYTGVFPFAEHTQWQRNAAIVPQLAQLRRRIRALERTPSGQS